MNGDLDVKERRGVSLILFLRFTLTLAVFFFPISYTKVDWGNKGFVGVSLPFSSVFIFDARLLVVHLGWSG